MIFFMSLKTKKNINARQNGFKVYKTRVFFLSQIFFFKLFVWFLRVTVTHNLAK